MTTNTEKIYFKDALNEREAIRIGLHDKLLISRCNDFTRKMLSGGMDLNKVCMFVKDYHRKYLFIKLEGGDYNAFTMEMWWKLGQRDGNRFAVVK